MNRQKAVIDANNVVYLQAPVERRPNIRNVLAIVEALEVSGRDPIVVIDPTIRPLLRNDDDLEVLLSDPRLISLPGGKEMGRFVLETADSLNALIVSNNTYVEYYEDYPWIEERRIPIALVNGAVLLLDKTKKVA